MNVVIVLREQISIFLPFSKILWGLCMGLGAARPSDVQQWPKARPRRFAPQGRAKSELRNVAPTTEGRRRPQKQQGAPKRQQGLQAAVRRPKGVTAARLQAAATTSPLGRSSTTERSNAPKNKKPESLERLSGL
ncbi:hypothetical protein SGRA_0124 [Saprospira grandis str. Lewin]|uniref:Uncharacterized protein n=1 Tax=Saprospira grandis (strain Lewin) TaxID=984262 RepID=H6L4Z7_SAPGL|nr:hypothetical protein SGRA_0124 [Saprospira grandis str. Lewin]